MPDGNLEASAELKQGFGFRVLPDSEEGGGGIDGSFVPFISQVRVPARISRRSSRLLI